MAKKLENVVRTYHVVGGIDSHQARSLHHLRGRDGGYGRERESHAVMDLGPTLARYVRMRASHAGMEPGTAGIQG
jgi:hypothetical protein